MNAFSLRPRKPFVPLAIAAIAGIFVADVFRLPIFAIIAAAVALGIVSFIVPNRVTCLTFTATAFAALHTTRHVHHPAANFASFIAVAPVQVTASGIVWNEPEVFVDGRGVERAWFWLNLEDFKSEKESAVRGLCVAAWQGKAPLPGDRITVTGAANPLPPQQNPGTFDTATWLRRKGIHFQITTASAADCTIIAQGAGAWWQRFATAGREWITQRLDLGVPRNTDTAALIHSMVLGMRGETPAELKEFFQKTGTLHLFAVSGLNVAMLALIAWYAMKPLQVGRKGAAIIIVPLLIAYAIVTGLGASCVRATVMCIFVLLAPVAERRPVVLNSIAAAAFLILGWDTNQLFSPGFQLSFVLVLVILALASRISGWVERLAKPDEFIPERMWTSAQKARLAVWKVVSATIGVTGAAWVGSLLFMAGYFHLFSWSAIVANLLAVPLAFCILSLGMLTLTIGLASTSLAVAVNHANSFCASALITFVTAFANLPGGHTYIELPTSARAAVCEITALDVGEGAAIHIRSGGDWLIDCGHSGDYARTLLPYLRSRGVNHLDGLLLTHGDSAHIGGAVTLLDDFQPGWIAEFGGRDRSPTRRAFHAELARREIGRRFFSRGQEVILAPGVKLRILYPPMDVNRPLSDDQAIVAMLEAAGHRVLITGDAAFSTEQWLIANEPDLRADVLIKGWPERDFSGTSDFVGRVAPRMIVCAAQKFGAEAKSFEQWAAPVRGAGIEVLNQAQCGAVRISIVQDELRVEKWRR